ncbi:nickel-dependent hydrogenase large subunit [Candidatus Nomurabacteria bacterium]|nr:nickel-dependent hydrogenase large subunit [Candidatus Nomurabacteria bacterium]
MTRMIIDPVTRIEGHLRVEVEIEGGKVKDAWSSGTLFRGFEIFMRGRDPRDAWFIAQRVCGVCTSVHALASVACVEDSSGVSVPDNARIIRNLILGAQYLHDHPVHFYHLHALDWVDVVSALGADPVKAASFASNHNSSSTDSVSHFKEVKQRLKKFVDSGQLGPFANGYWGHPAYHLPSEVNLMAVSHYLEALEVQRKAAQMMAIFGGKNPHIQTSVPGGVTVASLLNVETITKFRFAMKEAMDFITRVYIPDVLAIAPLYLDWAGYGASHGNYLAWGMMPQDSGSHTKNTTFPSGMILNRDLAKVFEVDPQKVTEHVKHSWYENSEPLNPQHGKTEPQYTGLNDFKGIDVEKNPKYSWLKAPRYENRPMEVGPLARVLIAYAKGVPGIQSIVNGVLTQLNVKPAALFSTFGRVAARALETVYIGNQMDYWLNQLLDNISLGKLETYTSHEIPTKGMGYGTLEAPRGALAHWIEIQDKRIQNYQLVVPTTWNVAPRDDFQVRGPLEEALIGTPVARADQPLEILRTIHSFDPCIACAVHVIDPKTNEVMKIKA